MESSQQHGRVQEITSSTAFHLALAAAGDQLVVVDFNAVWCGPCKTIAPAFAQLSNKHNDVVFLKVDVDKVQPIANTYSITKLPTFTFFSQSTKIAEFSGANISKLEEMINTHKNALTQNSSTSSSSSSGERDQLVFPTGFADLVSFIDKTQCLCLNEKTNKNWKNLLTADDNHLESDCDEQLLIYIPFNQPVKIHSVCFVAPKTGHGPKSVKLFVNQPHLDFQSVDSEPAAQEFNLTENDLEANTLNNVKFVKFQNVTSLTVFVESNQGGEEFTQLRRFRIIGTPLDNTNMKDFKRVSGEKGEAHG